MIVSKSDFVLGNNVPNSKTAAPLSGIEGGNSELDSYIDRYENTCLIEVLGFELFKEVQDAYTALNSQQEIPLPDKIDKLINGENAYQGMKLALVNFIYFNYLESKIHNYSTADTKNSSSIIQASYSFEELAIKAWREFYKLTVGDYKQTELRFKSVGFIVNHNVARRSNIISTFEYICDNKETYDNWSPSNIKNINKYGF